MSDVAKLSALDVPANDAHQHVDFGSYSAGASGAEAWLRSDFEHRIEMMDEHGILQSVLMPSYDYDKRLGLASTERVIEGLQLYQSWAPDRFPWLGCTVEPQHYDGAVELLEETLRGGKFPIASWHNRYQGLSVDAPVMFEFAEVAAGAGCVIYLHTTANLDHEESWRISRIARAFPNARFVVLDSMMVNPSIQMLADLMRDVDNVWIDTAGAIAFVHLMKHLGNQVGWQRVLFGSDYYGVNRGGDAGLMRQQIQRCGLDDGQLEGVFRTNLLDALQG